MNDNHTPPYDAASDELAPIAGLELVYISDPMCSWCYGFSPIIKTIARQFEGRMPVWPLMGGLRAGNTAPMTEADKDYIRGAWANVAKMSGKKFNQSFFEREGFVYDTEPACRAVLTMRIMEPDRALEFLEFVATAFYTEGRDTTKDDVLIDLAEEFGADRARFERGFKMPDVIEATARDFTSARQLGVQAFPTLMAGNDSIGYTLLSNGYIPFAELSDQLEAWYDSQMS